MAPTCLVQSQLSWELPTDPPPALWSVSEALKHNSLLFFHCLRQGESGTWCDAGCACCPCVGGLSSVREAGLAPRCLCHFTGLLPMANPPQHRPWLCVRALCPQS